MRKWLGRILTTLSLLPLLGTAGMWVRSQWVWDDLRIIQVLAPAEPLRTRDMNLLGYRGSLALRVVTTNYLLVTRLDVADVAALRRYVDAGRGFAHSTTEPRPLTTEPPFHARLGFNSVRDRKHNVVLVTPGDKVGIRNLADIDESFIAVPWWFLTLCFALAPARAAHKWRRARRRRRRRAAHQCPACGYDCRATPDGAGPLLPACPECGRATAPR